MSRTPAKFLQDQVDYARDVRLAKSAFDLLLALAWTLPSGQGTEYLSPDTARAMAALDAAHPDWREWS